MSSKQLWKVILYGLILPMQREVQGPERLGDLLKMTAHEGKSRSRTHGFCLLIPVSSASLFLNRHCGGISPALPEWF